MNMEDSEPKPARAALQTKPDEALPARLMDAEQILDGIGALPALQAEPAAGQIQALRAILQSVRQELVVSPAGSPAAPPDYEELRQWNLDLEYELADRERTDQALQRANERLHSILESITDAFITLDTDWRFRVINPAAEALIFHRPAAELLGKVYWEEYPQAMATDFYQRCQQAMAEQTPVHFESQLVIAERWFEIHAYPRRGRIEVYYRDINDRKVAEQELQSYAQQLERVNQELRDFTFIASHDLQEPLRKVRAFGERLEKECSGRISEEGQDYLRRVLSATQRMQAMLNGLLSYSRVTTHAQAFQPIPLQLVIEEVLQDLEARLEQTGGEVRVEPLPTILGDPVQIRLLFQNLIANALKYHRPNVRPVVTVFGINPEEEADCGRVVQVGVRDNGIGFDEAQLDTIFLPFRRLHDRSEYEGTGIGLAICRKIVQRHRGSITACSKVGEGSVFIVSFPA